MNRLYKSLILVPLLAGLSSLAALAIDLKVNFTDGRTASFPFSTRPVITYTASDMVITASGSVASYARKDIADFTFSESSGVGAIDADNLQITLDGRRLAVKGLPDDARIAVYDLGGTRHFAPASRQDGSVALDLGGMAPGVYLVDIPNHHTIKISLK